MSISVNIKKEHLTVAVELLSNFDVMYKIKEGFIFGKPCYWIDFNSSDSVEHLLMIKNLSQNDE